MGVPEHDRISGKINVYLQAFDVLPVLVHTRTRIVVPFFCSRGKLAGARILLITILPRLPLTTYLGLENCSYSQYSPPVSSCTRGAKCAQTLCCIRYIYSSASTSIPEGMYLVTNLIPGTQHLPLCTRRAIGYVFVRSPSSACLNRFDRPEQALSAQSRIEHRAKRLYQHRASQPPRQQRTAVNTATVPVCTAVRAQTTVDCS